MATALAGTLLATTLVAVGRTTRQVRRAQDRLAALDFADRFLIDWMVGGAAVAAPEGLVPGHAGWAWRLTGRAEPGLAALGAHLGTIEVLGADAEPLASIEFVSTSPLTLSRLTLP